MQCILISYAGFKQKIYFKHKIDWMDLGHSVYTLELQIDFKFIFYLLKSQQNNELIVFNFFLLFL